MQHFADLRQELAVRERQQEVTRKSAPSSPTLDCEKMDSAVQASLSLPATPVGKGAENSFPSPRGSCRLFLPGLRRQVSGGGGLPKRQELPRRGREFRVRSWGDQAPAESGKRWVSWAAPAPGTARRRRRPRGQEEPPNPLRRWELAGVSKQGWCFDDSRSDAGRRQAHAENAERQTCLQSNRRKAVSVNAEIFRRACLLVRASLLHTSLGPYLNTALLLVPLAVPPETRGLSTRPVETP